MATLPLKYCKTIKDALKYVDDYEIKKNHIKVKSEAYYDEFCYQIYHYDTHIANIYTETRDLRIFSGAYSKSDCDIINSFCILYNIPYKAKRSGKNVYAELEYIRI